jgi:hypothetical protein
MKSETIARQATMLLFLYSDQEQAREGRGSKGQTDLSETITYRPLGSSQQRLVDEGDERFALGWRGR